MGPTLVLLDVPEQVEVAASVVGASDRPVYVAGTPAVGIELDKRGTAYHWQHEFADNRRLHDIDVPVLRGLEEVCRLADDRLTRRFEAFRATGFQPFALHYLALKRVVDNTLIRLAEVAAAIDGLKPARVICFAVPERRIGAYGMFDRDESLYGLTAPIIGQARGISVDALPFEPSRAAAATVAGSPAAAPRWRDSVRRQVGLVAADVRKAATLARRRLNGGDRRDVLVLQPIAEQGAMSAFARVWSWPTGGAVYRDGKPVFWPSSPEPPPSAEVFDEVWTGIAPELARHPLFRTLGFAWWSIVEPHFRHVATSGSHHWLATAQAARAALATIRPDAVTVDNLSNPHVKVVAMAARASGIPVIGSHHGQLGDVQLSFTSFYEFPHCDHYLVYTPETEAFVRENLRFDFQMHVAGSYPLEKVRHRQPSKREICRRYGLDPSRPLILFPTLAPHGVFSRIGDVESDTKAHVIHEAIVNAVAAHPEVQLIVKGLAGETERSMPLIRTIRLMGRPDVLFVNDLRFPSFLDAADAIIMDNPGLSLIEALTRTMPIYIYNDCYRWTREAEALLRRDIVFERDLGDFLARLHSDLDSGRAFVRRRGDSGFLKRYGDAHGGAGASARAARIVAGIIDQRKSARRSPTPEAAPHASAAAP